MNLRKTPKDQPGHLKKLNQKNRQFSKYNNKAFYLTFIFLTIFGELLAVYWVVILANFMKIIGFALHILMALLFTFFMKKIKDIDLRIDDNFVLMPVTRDCSASIHSQLKGISTGDGLTLRNGCLSAFVWKCDAAGISHYGFSGSAIPVPAPKHRIPYG